MQKKIISILLNQYFIAFCITIGTIAFLPNYFSKYQATLKSQTSFEAKIRFVYYADLNNDYKSEKIYCFDNTNKNACICIYTSEGDLIDQWNFNSYYPKKVKQLWFLDADNNGFKEIYLITQKNDSVFLNVVEPFVKNGINQHHIFIDRIQPFNNSFNFSTSTKAFLLKNRYENEVAFTLVTGFAGSPRNAYKYNLRKNKIYKSPHLTNKSAINQVIDVDNDGLDEILLINHSAGNEIDTLFTKRTDNSAWLMLLNNDLSFRFTPVEFKALFSGLQSFIFKSKDTFKIVSLLNSKQLKIKPVTLYLYSITGKKLKEKALPSFGQNNALYLNSNKKTFTIYDRNSGLIKVFNYNLKEINTFSIQPETYLYKIDINNDGKKEWLNFPLSKSVKTVTIYQENFDFPISFKIPKQGLEHLNFGLKEISKHKNDLYFQEGNEYFVYGYERNPLYFIKYVFFFGVYLVVLGLVFLIIKGQKLREAKQKAIEKEITQLQLKTIKNQVDSHFVFNAINTISEMKLTDDKLAADDFICKFSDFMRKTLQQSDSITNTLEEELAYVENYLKIQQVRFNHNFSYHIKIHKGVHKKMPVPKHAIFTYVENAVKHGLSHKKNGWLNIKVKKKGKTIVISVEDNGGGINKKNNTKRNSTGNGLLIMEKIYKYYTKLTKQKVEHSLVEIVDNENNVTGLRIEVRISK
ncbi:MAG: sensor histidine kinase [Lutibacter sp.]